jgi:hypothetical protein
MHEPLGCGNMAEDAEDEEHPGKERQPDNENGCKE